mmetsp:Transcript_4787/g.8040  ORF Transcript_4787/g.8040 Transcript_4787/m.8040 type:complete len:140 (+) Transcript_4787:1-420(+)
MHLESGAAAALATQAESERQGSRAEPSGAKPAGAAAAERGNESKLALLQMLSERKEGWGMAERKLFETPGRMHDVTLLASFVLCVGQLAHIVIRPENWVSQAMSLASNQLVFAACVAVRRQDMRLLELDYLLTPEHDYS